MALSSQSQRDAVDSNYRQWKNWRAQDFGALKPSTAKYYEAELKRAGLHCQRDLRLLEIGFGNGAFMEFCRQRDWVAVGTEMNMELVALAQDAGFDARPADALADMPESEFDAVVLIDVLEHIPQGHAVGFLESIVRVLRPGGVAIAHFPNGDSPFGLAVQNGDATHTNAIGSGKAQYYVDAVGAQTIFIGGEAQPILAGSFLHATHRIIALPFRMALNLLVRLIYFPGSKIDFSSPNLTMIFRKIA